MIVARARTRSTALRSVATAVLSLGAMSAVAVASGTPAADGVRVIRHGSAHEFLFDLAFDGARGVAAGGFGTLLASADGGATWQGQASPPATPALLGVAVRAGRCLAVGQMGAILVADDCARWQPVAPLTDARLMAVSLNARGRAVAVGAFGTVLHSADGGHNWQPVAIDWARFDAEGAEPHLYDVHVSEAGQVTVVGEFGMVLHSEDGREWRLARRGEQALFGLHMNADGKGYAVGQAGTVLATTNGGRDWREQRSGGSAMLTGVWSDGKGRVVASGINTILRSEDDGSNWRPMRARAVTRASHPAVAAGQPEGGPQRLIAAGTAATLLELTQ